MPKNSYIAVVVVASFISGIVGPALLFSPLSTLSSNGSGAYQIVLCLSLILITILISFISGYKSTNFDSLVFNLGDKTKWKLIFFLTTATYFFSASIMVFVIFVNCLENECGTGTGLEPLMGFIICIPVTAILALFNGLVVTSFFIIGMRKKYYY